MSKSEQEYVVDVANCPKWMLHGALKHPCKLCGYEADEQPMFREGAEMSDLLANGRYYRRAECNR